MATNFIGQDGFIWFVGVVEDRMDPKYAGRVRVRCVGYHTQNKTDLPTEDLPWAQVLLPITSSGISGIGQTPLGLVEGSHCVGLFRDAPYNQEPVIIGSFPGIPKDFSNTAKGFSDPEGIYPKYKGEPDTNRLAVNWGDGPMTKENPHAYLSLRSLTRITGIATADFDAQTAADGSTMAASDGTTWDQPELAYKAIYPKNHVYQTESGHIKEYDDTPLSERIYESHATGTSYELDPAGNRIDIIKGSSYTLTNLNNHISIGGNSDITIDGRHKVYINKGGLANNHYDIQVGPNASVNVQVDAGDINLVTMADGNINVNASGNYNVKVGGNYTMTVAGNRTISVDKATTDETQGAVIHRGKRIDLNP